MKKILSLFLLFSFNYSHALTLENVKSISALQSSKTTIFDKDLVSPKSLRFSSDGKKLYINALEAHKTLIYSYPEFNKIGDIEHKFNKGNESLFMNNDFYQKDFPKEYNNINHFLGKPVESALIKNGKYLLVPYYRRSFDSSGIYPSAFSVIDTTTDKIVKVFPSGPITKYITVSPDQNYIATIHWGNNSYSIIDAKSNNPEDWKMIKFSYIDNKKINTKQYAGSDRDKNCGYCLRGSVFSPDNKYLFISKMGQGGLVTIDMNSMEQIKTDLSIPPTPRHILIDNDWIVATSGVAGSIEKTKYSDYLTKLNNNDKNIWQSSKIGSGGRTLVNDNKHNMYWATMHDSSELVGVNKDTLKPITRIKIPHYAVGLDISPDNKYLLVTSQGKNHVGGHIVSIIEIKE